MGASLDYLADLRIEADASETGKASHARKDHVNDKPFDIIVSTARHENMGYQTWVTCSSLQRVQRACSFRHEGQLGARDTEGNACDWIRESPFPGDRLSEYPTFECPTLSTLFAEASL